MAYDSARGATVLFGGTGYGGLLGDTWEWNGTTWTSHNPATSPPARFGHAMAYDSVRGVTVLFGGSRGGNQYLLNDTWEWNGTIWTQRNPTVSPPGLYEHAMAYDSARGVTVLFGGDNMGSYDLWEWDGTNWTQRHISFSPSPQARYGHSMVYDSARGVTVLFGGIGAGDNSGETLIDTWEWNGTTWTVRRPTVYPPPLSLHSMAYDSARGVTVLFGGFRTISYLNDTWEWDGTNWTQRSSASSPSVRAAQAMAYDSASSAIVLFGGYNNVSPQGLGDSWQRNGANWLQLNSTTSPPARYAHAMAFDQARDTTVMFGGDDAQYDAFGDTWILHGQTWTQFLSSNGPPNRAGHAMAFDPGRNVTVLFGGGSYDSEGHYYSDTWEWNGLTWNQRSPATRPPARDLHAMAFDSLHGVTVLFGGDYYDDYAYVDYVFNDTWEWNGVNWTQFNPSISPPVRSAHAMAFDSARGVLVLFGGWNNGALGDTWEWNGTNWSLTAASEIGPPARYSHAMAYDSSRNVTLLYGGVDINNQILIDTWEWNGTTWTQTSMGEPGPTSRNYCAMTYDSVRRASILFGGHVACDCSGLLNDTWAFGVTTPFISREPSGLSVCADANPTLSVTVSSTNPPLTYQWQKDGNNITNPSGQTPTLTLPSIGPGNAGDYYCVITDACASVTSTPANITVLTGGSGDANGDGHADPADIPAFVDALLGNTPVNSAYCAVDMNADGLVDAKDIQPFVYVALSGN